jgi:TRAP-type C4-dicarboxylate transport system permease small subunit
MLKNLESYIGGLLVLAALMLFLSGMVFRLISSPLSGGWIREVSIYMVAWGLLMSAAGCVAHGEHVRADFFLAKASGKARHLADILAAAAGLIFCVVLAWFGYAVVEFAFAWDERGPSFLQIPTGYYYAALPVSMALCSLRYLILLGTLLRGQPAPSSNEF